MNTYIDPTCIHVRTHKHTELMCIHDVHSAIYMYILNFVLCKQLCVGQSIIMYQRMLCCIYVTCVAL